MGRPKKSWMELEPDTLDAFLDGSNPDRRELEELIRGYRLWLGVRALQKTLERIATALEERNASDLAVADTKEG